VKNGVVFMLLLCAILVAEYFLYTYYASQADLMNGVYNAVIGLLLLLLLFFRRINSLFSQVKQTSSFTSES
jgi:hypothetical protein